MLDKGEEKIKKICDVLRHETIEPAKQEAEKIIEDAHKRAEGIVEEAEQKIDKMKEDAKAKIEQERNVFHSSLEQAAKQSIEALRQSIEQKFFNDEMAAVIEQETSNPKVIAQLISNMIKAIEEEGTSADFSALIPKTVDAEEVARFLGEGIIKKLREKSVLVGDFNGGAQVKLHDKRMTIDVTAAALKELMLRYVRKDFRKLIFI